VAETEVAKKEVDRGGGSRGWGDRDRSGRGDR